MSASVALPMEKPAAEKPAKPLAEAAPRLWPAVVLVIAYWCAWTIVQVRAEPVRPVHDEFFRPDGVGRWG